MHLSIHSKQPGFKVTMLTIPSEIIQGFVLVMVALMILGTIIQMIHHKNITYFLPRYINFFTPLIVIPCSLRRNLTFLRRLIQFSS